MKRILYVRQKNDVFLKCFLSYLDPNSFQIYILDLKHAQFIDHNTNKIISLFGTSKNRWINYTFRFINALSFIKQNSYIFDICHILNLKHENFWLIPYLNKKCKSIIVTVYGRSTYSSLSKRIAFRYIYKFIHILTFSNSFLIREFIAIYKDINVKIVNIIPPVEAISDKKECSPNDIIHLGIDPNLIKIICSSTIASYDQHLKVIKALSQISNRRKSIQLIFLLTYGGNENEKNTIKEYIRAYLSDFHVKVFDSFLTKDDLACVRSLVDIYINSRLSDNLAGAVLESLYYGSLLISGSWLNYESLDEAGIYYKKFDTFEDLPKLVDSSIMELPTFRNSISSNNMQNIESRFGLKNVMEEWIQIYSK